MVALTRLVRLKGAFAVLSCYLDWDDVPKETARS